MDFNRISVWAASRFARSAVKPRPSALTQWRRMARPTTAKRSSSLAALRWRCAALRPARATRLIQKRCNTWVMVRIAGQPVCALSLLCLDRRQGG